MSRRRRSGTLGSIVAPQPGQDGFSRGDGFADAHLEFDIRRKEHVHSRSELHEADPLAEADALPFLDPADDPPREDADHLSEDDRGAAGVDPDFVELVLVRARNDRPPSGIPVLESTAI